MELQQVDFDRLGEMGLFGIFGPTGSGKSTILDALTLALYGTVQRASNRTQGIMNTALNDMRVAFTFDLQKEGKRKTYRVERVFRRKKDSDISIETKLVRLFEVVDCGEQIMSDKLGDVNTQIIDLIGLQFDDFTRSVVLPQNKFQEFLLSPKADKTKMLERIFYLEEYGKLLSEKLNRKTSIVKHKQSRLEGALSALGDLSAEALISAEHKMKDSLAKKQRLDMEFKALEEQYQHAKGIWEITLQYNDVEEKLQKCLAEEQHIMQKREICSRAQKANQLAVVIRDFCESEKRLRDTEKELNAMEAEYKAVEQELMISEIDFNNKNSSLKQKLPGLIEYKTKLSELEEVVGRISSLDVSLKDLREKYVFLKTEADKYDKKINEHKQKLEEIGNETKSCRMAIESSKVAPDYKKAVLKAVEFLEEADKSEANVYLLKQKHEEAEKSYEKLTFELEELSKKVELEANNIKNIEELMKKHYENKPVERNELAIMEAEHLKLKFMAEQLVVKQRDMSAVCLKLEEIINLTEQEIKLRQSYSEEKTRYTQMLAEIDEELEKYSLDIYSINILASKLENGKPCPVCGSTEHPMPGGGTKKKEEHENDIVSEKLRAERQQLEIKIKNSENAFFKSDARLSSLADTEARMREELAAKENEIKSIQSELPDQLRDMKASSLLNELQRLIEKSSELHKQLEIWENTEKTMLAAKEAAVERIGELKLINSALAAQIDIGKDALTKATLELQTASEQHVKCKQAFDDYISDKNITNPREMLEKLYKSEEEIERLHGEIEKLQAEEKSLRMELDSLNNTRSSYQSRLAEIEAEGRGIKAQHEELHKKVSGVLGEKDLKSEILSVDREIEELQQMAKAAEEKWGTVKEAVIRASASIKSLQNQKRIYSDSYNRENKRLQHELSEKGFSDIAEAESAIMPEGQLQRELDIIKEFEERKLNLEVKKSLFDSKLEGRRITEEEWLMQLQSFEAAQKEREQSIIEFENSKNSFTMIKQNYEKWVVIDREMKVIVKKREMLEQVQKLLKGNGFIEFIAEERLRYIAKEATETLGVLTKHRYALELDTENGFMIRDNANGGVLRMVSTLSGGETFLTSLSLALALSSQLQLKGQSPLEFFFLDEGFGTLDSNLLDTVIDSLERLSSTRRVIGLISHVPELKSRISRRLIVEAPTRDGKGSSVFVENA